MQLNSILSRIIRRGIYWIWRIRNGLSEICFTVASFLYGFGFSRRVIKGILNVFNLEIRRFAGIEEYQLFQPSVIQLVHFRESVLHYSQPIFSDENSRLSELKTSKGKNYCAVIKSSCVIGGSNLILLENDTVLYDVLFSKTNSNYRYIDGAIRLYRGNLCLIRHDKPILAIDQGILVSGNFSWNYFHLLLEIIVKFKAINETDIDQEIPLLIDRKCQDVPQYAELITIFNKSNRKIIPLDFGKRYSIKRLYYFSNPNFIPPHFIREIKIKSSDCLYDLTSLEFLRASLLPVAKDESFPSRIFISRSNASDRRKFNEGEVFQLMEKYGFVKIRPENYSITEQAGIFSRADFIAGGSGAAFTNLLFCKKSCKVLCFTNYKIPLSIFSTIANFAGCEMVHFYDHTKKLRIGSRLHDPFKINISLLNRFLSKWLQTDIS